MAIFPSAGVCPVAFFNTLNNQYNQVEIPLSAVYFTDNGVDATSWPLYATYQAQASSVLGQLASQGYLTAGAIALTDPPGLTATATLAGAAGNGITIQIASPSLSSGTATVTVSKNESYPGLTPATLASVLGDSVDTAAGLVYVSGAVATEMPAAFSGAIGSGFDVTIAEAADAGTTAFKLATTLSGDTTDAELIQIVVTPAAGTDPTTFSLDISWNKPFGNVSLAGLTSTADNPFSYLVSFTGQMGPMPSISTVTLTGGAAASGSTPAVSASASLLAGS
jgi:hypothetical protein